MRIIDYPLACKNKRQIAIAILTAEANATTTLEVDLSQYGVIIQDELSNQEWLKRWSRAPKINSLVRQQSSALQHMISIKLNTWMANHQNKGNQ